MRSVRLVAAFSGISVAKAFIIPSIDQCDLVTKRKINPKNVRICDSAATSWRLHNVPPPSIDDPKATKEASDREPPPKSFFDLQINSARAAQLAMDDGHKLLEVEFPPLPANVLEMDDVSAYEVAQANTNLAIDFSKSMVAQRDIRVTIMFPDEAEANIQKESLGDTDTPSPGVKISSLRRSKEGDNRLVKPESFFLNLFGGGSGGQVQPEPDTDMYVIVVASAQELPDVEELVELDPGKTIVFYNLKLDVLRGDLGAPAFPPKDFQDRFLSKIKPVYYLRTRQYSRSTANPPYIINFQGCLFRSYPGVYQTLLDTGTGSYRRVKGNSNRPALGEFKQELTNALEVDGVLKEEVSILNFLRTGYKVTTWWEDDRENASNKWRT